MLCVPESPSTHVCIALARQCNLKLFLFFKMTHAYTFKEKKILQPYIDVLSFDDPPHLCLFPGVSGTMWAHNKLDSLLFSLLFSFFFYLLYTSLLLQSFTVIMHFILAAIELSFHASSFLGLSAFFFVLSLCICPCVSWYMWLFFSFCRKSGKEPKADGEAAATAGERPGDFFLPRWPQWHVLH